MKKSNYITELIFLGFLLIVGITFMITLIKPENDPLQIVDSVEYGRVIVGIFLIAVVAVLVQTLLRFSAYMKIAKGTAEDEGKSEIDRLAAKLVIATSAVFLFYCFFMQRLGYYATGLLVLEVYQLILYRVQNEHIDLKGVLEVTAISVGVTLGLFLLFSVAFQLYLPRGILR